MSIGSIESTERGSGARNNSGKPAMELVPLRAMAAYYRGPFVTDERLGMIASLDALGRFQEGGGAKCLQDALQCLGNGWQECAEVFDFGRRKYAAWNWAKGMAWTVPLACAARHLMAMLAGEVLDPESKKPHRGHVYCNVAMLLTFITTYPEGDDRPAKGLLSPEAPRTRNRIYVAGPMTGKPDLNFPAFNAEARRLRAEGWEVVNPAEINPDHGKPWAECMRSDIAELVTCEAISLLPGWEDSRGATLEHHIAQKLGLRVLLPAEVFA